MPTPDGAAVRRAIEPARLEVARLAGGAREEPGPATPVAEPGLTPAACLHATLLLELVRWQGLAQPETLVGLAWALDCELPPELAGRITRDEGSPPWPRSSRPRARRSAGSRGSSRRWSRPTGARSASWRP